MLKKMLSFICLMLFVCFAPMASADFMSAGYNVLDVSDVSSVSRPEQSEACAACHSEVDNETTLRKHANDEVARIGGRSSNLGDGGSEGILLNRANTVQDIAYLEVGWQK